MAEAEEMPTRTAPKGKSIFERGVKMEPPTVDYQKNLETMRQSGSPESVMFTPGRQLEAIDQQIMRGEARKGRLSQKAAELAAERRAKLDQQEEQEQNQGAFGKAVDFYKDAAIGLVGKGGMNAVQGLVGLGELATGWIPGDKNINPLQIGQWGKMMDRLNQQFGFNFEDSNKFLTGFQSAKLQKELGNVEEAKGFFNTVKALGLNPLALVDNILGSIPSMITGGVAAGGVTRMWVTKAAKEAATLKLTGEAAEAFIKNKVNRVARITSHAAEGALTAGSIADEARAQGVDWEDYVLPALGAGVGTGLIGVGAGKLGSRLGIGDVDTAIAARAAGFKNTGAGIGDTNKSFAKFVAGELLKEGVLEEMPQSAQEKIFSNLATGRPWSEGVEEAAAQGLMAGAGMGGGHAVISKALQRTGEIVEEQKAKFAQSIVDQRPMSAEDLAKSKGFLRKEKGKETKSEDDLIADLDKYNQDQIDAEDTKAESADAKLVAQEAADERAAIQATHEFVPLDESGVPESPDIVAPPADGTPTDFDGAPLPTQSVKEWEAKHIELSNKVAAKEKDSNPKDWTPEERAAYDSGDWKKFSRLRGYTEDEITEFEAYLASIKEGQEKHGLSLDDIQGLELPQVTKTQPQPAPAKETKAETTAPNFKQQRQQVQDELNAAEERLGALEDELSEGLSTLPISKREALQDKIEAAEQEVDALKDKRTQALKNIAKAEKKYIADSSGLAPVENEQEIAEKIDDEGIYFDIEDEDDIDPSTGDLWPGYDYYAIVPSTSRYDKPSNPRLITNLEDAKKAKAAGMQVRALERQEPKTVAELEQEIAKLKGQRNKLLTPTGKEPKPDSKKGREWATLTRQINELWGQVSRLETEIAKKETPKYEETAEVFESAFGESFGTDEPETIDIPPEISDDTEITADTPIDLVSATRAKDPYGNTVTNLTFTNGAAYQIVRLNTTESMGLPGWHDANKFHPTDMAYLGDTKEEAVKELKRRETARRDAEKETIYSRSVTPPPVTDLVVITPPATVQQVPALPPPDQASPDLQALYDSATAKAKKAWEVLSLADEALSEEEDPSDGSQPSPVKLKQLSDAREKAHAEWEVLEKEAENAFTALTHEPYTIEGETRIVEETVAPQLAALPAPDIDRLEKHYGLSAGSRDFILKVKEDIVRYANEGAEVVAEAIRDIIGKLHAGVLAAAIILNPTNVSTAEFVTYPTATIAITEQVLADLPEGTEMMSDGAKESYRVLYPAIKDKLQADDKILTIVDKPKGHTYLFKPNGTLLLRTKTLTGLAPGDFFKGNNTLPQNRITPAGFFTFGLRDALRSAGEATTAGEYDFGKVFVLDKVFSGEYSMTLMHSVWLNESDASMRAKAIASDSETDSRYSFGCINVNKPTYKFLIDNHLKQMDGSSVFIVPDNPANLASLLSGKPENRDGLERNVFTPPTKTVNRTIDSATTTPNLASAAAADRRRNMFRSIVANALPTGTVEPNLAESIAHNRRGVNKLDALYKEGKITPEQYAEAMLKINESIQERADRNRYGKSKQRGFGRVVSALEDAKKAGRISPETADFAIWFLIQNPALADDLAIEVALPKTKREKEAAEGTAGSYNHIARIVRLVTRKAPTPFETDKETGRYAATKEETAVHEILHHLERMLPVQVRRLIRNEWSRQIRNKLKEAAKTKNVALQFYLNNVIKANTEQDMDAWMLASKAIQNGDVPYEMYALFNPSEFWAVNGSNLLSDRYYVGTKFQKAKQWLREFIEMLKSVFGITSDDPIIQGLNAVLRGDGTFVSRDMLVEGKADQTFRQIIQKGLHPSVVEAINNNDISGALRAVAKNTSGLYSVLAARLAELDLPTTIGFNRERELVRQHIDSRSSQQQVQLFTYVRRAYPALYEKYFKNYDKPESLELVYQGLKELYKPEYNTSPLTLQLALVRDEFDKTMPGLVHSGLYMPSSDAISLRTGGQFGLTNRVFLHEVVHAATEFVLRSTTGLNQRQREGVTQLYVLYNYAKSELNIEAYGFKNVFEFVAEALTNADFQKKLRGVKYEPEEGPTQGSIYNSLLRFAMKMFGADNVAGATIIQANEVFSAVRPAGAVSGSLRFSSPIKGKKARYRHGPLTSKWRTAEDIAVSIGETFKAAMTSIPELSKLSNAVRRRGVYSLRNLELPMLGLRMLKEDVQQSNPYIGAAVKIIGQMSSYRGRIVNEADKIITKWAEMQLKKPAQSRLMSRIMLEATIQGIEVDPLGPGYIDPVTAKPDDKVAPQQLVDAWNKLLPEFQELYRTVRNYYTDLLKATIREMKLRVLSSGKTSAEKKDLIRKINKQFAEENFDRPYFPLRRFGEFWFQVTANGRSEFYTFDSHINRDLAYDRRFEELSKGNATQQQAAKDMRAGNSISQLYTDNKDIGGALKDVKELIDAISDTVTTVQGGQPHTTQKSADAIKEEIKGAVDQLVYILLPQQSMRKMFINRRAVQGASGDMLRVFAETSVRAAYQQSRFKYVQPFLNNMTNAHDYVRRFVKGKRQTSAIDNINEVEKRYKYMFGMEDTSPGARFVGGVNQFSVAINLTAPASALMNVIAFPIMAERTIGGKYGVVKANKVIAKYFGQYMRTMPKRTLLPLGKGMRSQIRWPSIMEGGYLKGASARAAQKYIDDGDVQISQISDAFDFARGPTDQYTTGKVKRVVEAVLAPFHQLDRLTREVTLMSVFDLAYEQYLTADKRDERGIIQRDLNTGDPLKYTEEEAFERAIEDARDAAAASLGEYLRQLKGRAFSHPIGALLLQFKQVSLTILRAIYRDMWLAFGAPLTSAERKEMKTFLEDQYKNAPNNAAIIEQQLNEYDAYQKEIHREAFRKVMIINVTAFLMAGAEGTPLYFLASGLWAIARVFAPDGDEWEDFQIWFFNMLMRDFSGAVAELAIQSGMDEESARDMGYKVAHATARGIPSAALNWSLTERIGVNPGEMLFRDARFFADATREVQEFVSNNLGAFPSYMLNTLPTAWSLVQQGHYERAYEKAFPAAITKPAQAHRFATEGAKRLSGKTIMNKEDFTKWDIASTAIGIRPEKLTLRERAASNADEKIVKLNAKKSALLDRIWVERLAGSPAENVARKEFYKFAARHPNFIDDPEKTIEDSFEKKYQGLADAAINFGVDIPDAILPEVAPLLSGARKIK